MTSIKDLRELHEKATPAPAKFVNARAMRRARVSSVLPVRATSTGSYARECSEVPLYRAVPIEDEKPQRDS